MLSWSNAVFAGWCSPGWPRTTLMHVWQMPMNIIKSNKQEKLVSIHKIFGWLDGWRAFTKSSFLESTLELVGPYMTLDEKKFQLELRQIFFNFFIFYQLACLSTLCPVFCHRCCLCWLVYPTGLDKSSNTWINFISIKWLTHDQSHCQPPWAAPSGCLSWWDTERAFDPALPTSPATSHHSSPTSHQTSAMWRRKHHRTLV